MKRLKDLTKDDISVWHDVDGCGEFTVAIHCGRSIKSNKKAEQIEQQILDDQKLRKLVRVIRRNTLNLDVATLFNEILNSVDLGTTDEFIRRVEEVGRKETS